MRATPLGRVIASLLLCVSGCATPHHTTAMPKQHDWPAFPKQFKTLQRVTFRSQGACYEWVAYVMGRDGTTLVAQVMEPSGAPVVRLSVSKDSFRVFEKGTYPSINNFERKLADALRTIFYSTSVSRKTVSDSEILSHPIQYVSANGDYGVEILILEMKQGE